MKNITNILQRSHLSPKDRILACIHNQVEKSRSGKEILSDADIVAISKNWRPKHAFEVDDFNRYNDSWDMISCLKIDAQTAYLNTALALESASSLCILSLHPNDHLKKHLFKSVDDEFLDRAFSEFINNTGLEYEPLKDNPIVVQLVEEGVLSLKTVITHTDDEETKTILIDGESMYHLEQEYDFILDFKKQVDDLFFFVALVEHIKRSKDFIFHYGSMLCIQEILKQSSALFETDLLFYVDKYILEMNEKIDLLNLELREVLNNLLEKIYSYAKYPIVFSPDNFFFSYENIKPRRDPSLERLVKEVNNLWLVLGRKVLNI